MRIAGLLAVSGILVLSACSGQLDEGGSMLGGSAGVAAESRADYCWKSSVGTTTRTKCCASCVSRSSPSPR